MNGKYRGRQAFASSSCSDEGQQAANYRAQTLAPAAAASATATTPKASRLQPLVPRDSKRFGDLYRGRGAVERAFGRLKNEYGLKPLRVRGLERVALHADLTVLAILSSALARARAVPLAA